MDQLKKLIESLSGRQRVAILFAAAAVVGGLLAFSHWRREVDFHPLYTSLAPEDAAAVVEKLKQSAVDYRLADNGSTVLVSSAKAAESRLALAAAGLPKSGRIGFELFDKNNLGATEFTEHINYHRALKGELERSVMSLGAVEQARIHLTFPKDSIYSEERQPAKASVLVRLKAGAHLAPANVTAISYLVASAVEGLGPESVTVVDTRGNLLNRPRKAQTEDGSEPSEGALDFRQNVEHDLLNKINATLEPLVGDGRFRVGVSVDCDFSSVEQSEEIFDPTRSVMASSQKTEDISGGTGASGVPGTASNLPRPTSRPGTMLAGVSRRTENIAYQTTRTVRHTRVPQGIVKRISLAVLVDQAVRWEGTGKQRKRVLVPPTPETLKAIRDLVAGVAGLTPDRGDQLTVEALPFESTLHPEGDEDLSEPSTPAPPPATMPHWLEMLRDPRIAAGAIGGAVLIIGLALFFLVRRRKHSTRATTSAALASADAAAISASLDEQIEARLAEQAQLEQKMELEALSSIKLPKVTTKKTEVILKQVKDLSKKDASVGAHVLRSWVGEIPQKMEY